MNPDTGRRLIAAMAMHGLAATATVSNAASGLAADRAGEGRRVEIVRFATVPVAIVRGAAPGGTAAVRRETVSFGNGRAVTIVRGIAAGDDLSPSAMFLPSSAPDFERIAEAVHGVESSYGADPSMWRPDPDGPQGPMQVSAAAAQDTGGGNRFDPRENRLLGRAYLARMFGRYGNWPDALAAYNWGPGNVDRWLAGGRDPAHLPLETVRYIGRVLRDARIVGVFGAGLPVTR